jgi:hypothetical protein
VIGYDQNRRRPQLHAKKIPVLNTPLLDDPVHAVRLDLMDIAQQRERGRAGQID